MKLSRKSKYIHRSRILYLMPSLVGVLVFVLLPFADVVRRSFFTAITEQFCGVSNYISVFTNQAFHLAVENTLRFVTVCLPLLIILSLLIAVLLQKSKWMQWLKSSYLFPLAVPTATVVLIWKMFFHTNGILNSFLNSVGLESIDWMGTNAAFGVLVFSYIWKNLGYTIVLWLAGLSGISGNMIEAARVDGATDWQSFRYVMLPNLKPTLYTITILSFLNSFKVFREAYLVAGAYPQKSIYLLQHIFNNWFSNLDLDKMSASAVIIALVLAGCELVLQSVWDKQE